jgi:hypothetical protein
MVQGRGSADLVMVNVAALLCLMVLTGLVHAATYTVGGSGGWTLNMDSWPKGKRFKAGDTLGKFRHILFLLVKVMQEMVIKKTGKCHVVVVNNVNRHRHMKKNIDGRKFVENW